MIEQYGTQPTKMDNIRAMFSAEDMTAQQRYKEAHFRDWLFRRAAAASGIALAGLFLISAARGEYTEDRTPPPPPSPVVEAPAPLHGDPSVSPSPSGETHIAANSMQHNQEHGNAAGGDQVTAILRSILLTLR